MVYVLPQQLLLDHARRQELTANGMLSQTHAAKSEALRRVLGIGGNTILQKLPVEGIMRRASVSTWQSTSTGSAAPPGLGNWNNSCYQNSVLQGLASLDSLRPYLMRAQGEESSTSGTLLEMINRLNDSDNNGKQLWTPAKLKSMSSWQQQDAQEYFSKIMDELDKEAAKTLSSSIAKPGLESITEEATKQTTSTSERVTSSPEANDVTTADQRAPMDGLLAQRVACTRCGFSEGLSLIPFNCLTVPLGSDFAYDLEECLDEYTKLEEISDVECTKCTLIRAEQQLKQMLPPPPSFHSSDAAPAVDSKVLALPPELRAQAFKRLSAIQQALEEDDFSDKTVNETCQIPKKAHVSSTKTRQAVIGRPPESLVVHVNRSVFDESTGVQRKNYASVRYPLVLDLKQWMLSAEAKDDANAEEALESMLSKAGNCSDVVSYCIKAVVTHYGRHENGHYICYRRHPVCPKLGYQAHDLDGREPEDDEPMAQTTDEERWWRLSDEDVSPVSEEDVLGQGGVFMLFYERQGGDEKPPPAEDAPAAATELEPSKAAQDIQSPDADLEEAASVALPVDADLDIALQPEEPLTATSEEPPAPFDHLPSTPSTEATTEDESEANAEQNPPRAVQKPPTPTLMRTARGRQTSLSERGFGGNAFWAVAAT